MVNFRQFLLSKLGAGSKKPASGDEHGKLPEVMQTYLVKNFKLLPENMADLRYVMRSDRFVRVYDVVEARAHNLVVKNFHHLDKHPKLVLFYGRFPKRGSMYLKRTGGATFYRSRGSRA